MFRSSMTRKLAQSVRPRVWSGRLAWRSMSPSTGHPSAGRSLQQVWLPGPDWTESRTPARPLVTPPAGIGITYVNSASSPKALMPCAKCGSSPRTTGSPPRPVTPADADRAAVPCHRIPDGRWLSDYSPGRSSAACGPKTALTSQANPGSTSSPLRASSSLSVATACSGWYTSTVRALGCTTQTRRTP